MPFCKAETWLISARTDFGKTVPPFLDVGRFEVTVNHSCTFPKLCGLHCLGQQRIIGTTCKGYTKGKTAKTCWDPASGGLCLQRRVPWYQCTTKYGVTKDTDVGGMPELACTITGFVVLAFLCGPTENTWLSHRCVVQESRKVALYRPAAL